jgi:hypothetical protein
VNLLQAEVPAASAVIVEAGCVAGCHGAFWIRIRGPLRELLDGGALPHGLVGREGRFVLLDFGDPASNSILRN